VTTRANLRSDGSESPEEAAGVSMSADGRYVSFYSDDTALSSDGKIGDTGVSMYSIGNGRLLARFDYTLGIQQR
jgi:hypothetical protein